MMRNNTIVATSLLLFSAVGLAQTLPDSEILARVAEFHGAAGVFAVAGYRIGARALAELDEKRGSFSLDVTHNTPFQVQWSCIADGIQAGTGVSAGKLNLHLAETSRDRLETVIWDKRSGKVLSFRLRSSFLSKYLDLPEDRQAAASREVLKMPDSEIFILQQKGDQR